MILPPVISQLNYPGAGDTDDCWCVATIWAALAADPSIRKPTVPEFRAAAHNPDLPGPTGGNLSQIVHASVALWPQLTVQAYSSTDWFGFSDKVRAGWIASLAVQSSALPAELRFGFLGAHQIGVAFDTGALMVMNPLARNGAALLPITELNLRSAARAVLNGWVTAALFQPITGGSEMIAAGGIRITSDKTARVTADTALLDAPKGKRLATAKVGYVYPYLGASQGTRAVLVSTAIPYDDHLERPTVLYTAAADVLIESVPSSAAPVKVELTINGKSEFSHTF